MGQSHRTRLRAKEPTTETATKQGQKQSNRAGPQTTDTVEMKSEGGYPEVWNVSQLIYTFQISEPGNSFRDEYRVTPTECCTFWNLGFECRPRSCDKWHVCCFESCRTSFHTEHRAIQHSPQPDCAQHAERLLGMNLLFPQAPMRFLSNLHWLEKKSPACLPRKPLMNSPDGWILYCTSAGPFPVLSFSP